MQNDILGEVEVPLGSLLIGSVVEKWYALKPCTDEELLDQCAGYMTGTSLAGAINIAGASILGGLSIAGNISNMVGTKAFAKAMASKMASLEAAASAQVSSTLGLAMAVGVSLGVKQGR